MFVRFAVGRAKPDMRKARYTMPVDDHAGRHASNLESLSDGALWIELHREVGMESLQKLFGIGPIVIEIDRDDG